MLLTLVPLLLAGVVTLEICVLVDLPLNFANIIALPLLLGVGVAFKIYYIMAWREGQTNLLQSVLTRAVTFSALHDGDRLRQPVVFQPSRHVQHGQAAGDLAAHDDGGGGVVPARADGQAARAAAAERVVICARNFARFARQLRRYACAGGRLARPDVGD